MSEHHERHEEWREKRLSIQILEKLDAIEGKVNQLMSQITDWAAKEEADLTAISGTLDGIVTGIAALDAKIQALQNSPGTLSASDQAALDQISTDSTALKAKAAGISTT